MSHPSPIMAVSRHAAFILSDFSQRYGVGLWISFDRYVSGHPAHRERAALVARLNARQGVSSHERRRHRHLRPVRHEKLRPQRKGLDVTEKVVPPAAVETRAVVAQ